MTISFSFGAAGDSVKRWTTLRFLGSTVAGTRLDAAGLSDFFFGVTFFFGFGLPSFASFSLDSFYS